MSTAFLSSSISGTRKSRFIMVFALFSLFIFSLFWIWSVGDRRQARSGITIGGVNERTHGDVPTGSRNDDSSKSIQKDSISLPFMKVNFEDHYVVIEEPSFCLAVPITPSGKLVMVRQRRRGARKECLEFPAGMIDDGKVYDCAKRELLEETGYVSENEHCTEAPVKDDDWAIHHDRDVQCTGQSHYLGHIFGEPARNRQRGYGFLFQVAEDPSEDVELDHEEREYKKTRVVKVSVDEVQQLIDQGEIIHAGHIALFQRAMYHLRQDQKHLER